MHKNILSFFILSIIILPFAIATVDMSNPNTDYVPDDAEICHVVQSKAASADDCGPNSFYNTLYKECWCHANYCAADYGCTPSGEKVERKDTPVENVDDNQQLSDEQLTDDAESEYSKLMKEQLAKEAAEKGCKKNELVDPVDGECYCPQGYYYNNFDCVPKEADKDKEKCGPNAKYNMWTDKCSCNKGYMIYTESVGCEEIYCGEHATYDVKSDQCYCKAGYAVGIEGTCIPREDAFVELNTKTIAGSIDKDARKRIAELLSEASKSGDATKIAREKIQRLLNGLPEDPIVEEPARIADGKSDSLDPEPLSVVPEKELLSLKDNIKNKDNLFQELDPEVQDILESVEKIRLSDVIDPTKQANGEPCNDLDTGFRWFNGECIFISDTECPKIKPEQYDLMIDQYHLMEDLTTNIKKYSDNSETKITRGSKDISGFDPFHVVNLGWSLATFDQIAVNNQDKIIPEILKQSGKLGRGLTPGEVLKICLDKTDGRMADAILACHNTIRAHAREIKAAAETNTYEKMIYNYAQKMKDAKYEGEREEYEQKIKDASQYMANTVLFSNALQPIRKSDNTGAWYHLFGTMSAGYSQEDNMGGFPTGLFMIDVEHGGPKETADPLEKCWDRNGIFVGRKIFKEITKDE